MPEETDWRVVIHRRAEKVLYRLPKDMLERVRTAINQLRHNPRPENSQKLAGYENLYRLRVGDWRISYAIEADQLVILVLEIVPRSGAYRKL